MTTIRLNCGHTYTDAADDTELRDRVLCDDCFDTGAPEYRRYVVEIRP